MQKEDDRKLISNILIIAARKADYFDYIRKSEGYLDRHSLSEEFLERLSQIIAEMDPYLFITSEERESRKLILTIRLEDLDREAIYQTIKDSLNQ
jgi:hypothetical protein